MQTRFARFLALAFVALPLAARADKLYALMMSGFDDFDQVPQAAIEIVDLESMQLVRSFALGARSTMSIAVSPDQSRIYVLDRGGWDWSTGTFNPPQIAVYDQQGNLAASWPMPTNPQWGSADSPFDCVLSQDGSRLYVTGYAGFYAFDTSSGAQALPVLATGDDTPLGLALSPDGSTLAAPSTSGGSNPAAFLVDAATMSLIARVAITPNAACTYPFPNDAAFTDNGRAIFWDSNCNAVFQVDVATRTYLSSQTVATHIPDDGAFFNFNNMLSYSPATKKAYAAQEQDYQTSQAYHLDAMDLTALTTTAWAYVENGTLEQGIPFVPAMNPAGTRLYVDAIHKFDGGGADTLDVVDTVAGTLTRGVYTFATTFAMPWNAAYPGSARDMHVVTSATPAQRLAQLIAFIQAEAQAGRVPQGNGTALVQLLQNAQRQLAANNTSAACGQLGAAQNKSAAFTSAGKLSAADGAQIGSSLQALSTSLHCR